MKALFNALLVVLMLALAPMGIAQQVYPATAGNGVPTGLCAVNTIYVDSETGWLWICNSSNVWAHNDSASVYPNAGAGLPSGMIAFIDNGTCPAGFTEVASLDGKVIRGTVASHADVGGTGGSDTATPTGTIGALTFTGSSATTSSNSGGTPAGSITMDAFSSVINHTHTVNVNDPGHNHTQNSFAPRIISSGTVGTVGVQGASAASNANASNSATTATNQSNTTGITATTSNPAGGVSSITPTGSFSGSALAGHTHTLTALGTINTPAFSGDSLATVPAYEKLIACKAN